MRLQLKISEKLTDKINSDLSMKNFVFDSLRRFNRKDWGMICESEKILNEMAIRIGKDIFGVCRQDKTFVRIVIRVTSQRAFLEIFLFDELKDGTQQFILHSADGKLLSN